MLGEVQAVPHRATNAVEGNPLHPRQIDAALQDRVLQFGQRSIRGHAANADRMVMSGESRKTFGHSGCDAREIMPQRWWTALASTTMVDMLL
jgi:hypothetical protein